MAQSQGGQGGGGHLHGGGGSGTGGESHTVGVEMVRARGASLVPVQEGPLPQNRGNYCEPSGAGLGLETLSLSHLH